MELNKKYYTGRALDNRMGGFMIAEVAKRLHQDKKKLDFGLYVVNSVQEEIGLRGAQMIAERIDPDVAIITDVTHDTNSPMYDKKKSGDIKSGDGPALTFGPAVQNNLLKLLIDTAKKNKINHQLMAASRFTGTDTDAFAYSNDGVASALISLPLKYMHTTVETVAQKDVESVIKLIYNSLLKIKNNQDFFLMTLTGILGGTAAILFIYAYRLISASKMASFEYFGIPSSFILGWFFFNEAPWSQLFPGVLVIVFAGMIIIWRDSIKQKSINITREIN